MFRISIILGAISFFFSRGLLAHEGHDHVVAVAGDFPNLHPLVVHLPIMFLMVAPVIQILAVFQKNRSTQFTVLAFALLGAMTAYASANTFHPHTAQLTSAMEKVLSEHEKWSRITIVLSWSALIPVLVASLAPARWRIPAGLFGGILLFLAAGSVAMTGHQGAKLVHIHGVGPRGRFLEE